jgi:hypothetical protein
MYEASVGSVDMMRSVTAVMAIASFAIVGAIVLGLF